jgi:DMSO/TMAO reductase YedYZ molybdopterin-dependent catalytic subunit
LHSEWIASWLGVALGISFVVCFLTGLLSHVIQNPPAWFHYPSRPAGLYRVTQGLHVATGIASIPLLLAKLWTVYPKLWRWPPAESVVHAVERLSLLPLVGGSVFLLFSGAFNTFHWYPWTFYFPTAHFWAAWITIGALVVHVGAKASGLRAGLAGSHEPAEDSTGEVGLGRRSFLRAVLGASGVLTLATIGQTWNPLGRIALLAPRRPDAGPQGFPVNRPAIEARVASRALDPGYRLRIEGAVASPLALSLDDLKALPQHDAELPISCVEGWSVSAGWTGVRLRDLLAMAGSTMRAGARVESLEPRGNYRISVLDPSHASDPDTLLALRVRGEPLSLDHGYPARLIAPNLPGVMQTKWVSRIVVL